MFLIINDALISTLMMFFIVGPGFMLTMFMSKISSAFTRQVCWAIGVRGYLLTFGWLGTAVHELSHAAIAVMFGHKIDEIKLFQIRSDSNRLGYVRLRYDKKSVYQRVGNLFIGVAPVFIGAIIIFLSAKILVPDIAGVISQSRILTGDDGLLAVYFNSFFSIFGKLLYFKNFLNPKYYLFMYIFFCIGSSMTLSTADLKGAKNGFAVFVGVLFIINIYREVLYSFSYPYWIINFTFFIYNLMAGILLLQLIIILLLKLFVNRRSA